jgi:hypothetical protein
MPYSSKKSLKTVKADKKLSKGKVKKGNKIMNKIIKKSK